MRSTPAAVAAARCAVEITAAEPERRQRLRHLVLRAQRGLRGAGCDLGQAAHQILPVHLGEDGTALAAAQALLAGGIFLQAIRPPTVPEGTARLRVTPMATHTEDEVAALADAIADEITAGR